MSVVGVEAPPATYSTMRCCPYHGGWIRLAECPIVATNKVMLGLDEFGADVQAPDIVIDLGASGSGRPRGRFVPGQLLESRIDKKPRTIVAAPPQRKTVERPRRFVRSVPPPLESPAKLAARFGGQRLRPVRACPDPACQHPLPPNIDLRDPISVAIVGNAQASKTTTVAALMSELGLHGPTALGLESFAPAEATSGALRQAVKSLRAGEKVEQTHGGVHAPLEFSTELRGNLPVTVLIHDVAGEDLMNAEKRLVHAPHVLWADVVLFLYNPEESARLAMLDSDADQSAVLTGLFDDLESDPPTNLDGSPRWPGLVVAVSKADLLKPPPDIANGPTPSEDVIQALYDLQDGNFVYTAKRWGDDVRWCFVAPQPAEGRPQGVVELFKQVLEIAAS
jgi:Double-GTPase 2